MDYLDYKPSSKLYFIINPFGFVNINKDGNYKGVGNFKVKNRGDINDNDFIKIVSNVE